jgi:hypothetical protein
MYDCDYIGYKKHIGDLVSSGGAVVSTGAKAFSSEGTDIGADIAFAASSVSFLSNLFEQWTSHPAADARDFISKLKPQLASADPYNRIIKVMAGDNKITHRAKDVSASELVLWYRINYLNDYMTLSPDVKIYWNNYLTNAANQATDVNQASRDYRQAMFTQSEIDYNATPTQTISNLLTSATGGKTNWLLYGIIGLGLLILFKKK